MTDSHAVTVVETAPPPTRSELERDDRARMHPLVRAAMNGVGEIDPASLEKLMDLQERWEAGESRKAYTRALVALKADLPAVIAKDATVDYQSSKGRTYYTHASLAGAMEAVTGPLTTHGFAVTWSPSVGERGKVLVTCRLTHSEGHFEEATIEAPPDGTGNKNSAQAVASTITYLRRYTALAVLGIATKDMGEPAPPEESAEGIDPSRNMAAVRALGGAGISLEEAETHVGALVSAWTKADRMKLRALLDAAHVREADERSGSPSDGALSPDEEATMERDLAERES